jgi:hypothetical protein
METKTRGKRKDPRGATKTSLFQGPGCVTMHPTGTERRQKAASIVCLEGKRMWIKAETDLAVELAHH